jgi:hypothetical protein
VLTAFFRTAIIRALCGLFVRQTWLKEEEEEGRNGGRLCVSSGKKWGHQVTREALEEERF